MSFVKSITLRTGIQIAGTFVRSYIAFEGGVRYIYIFRTAYGEIRCVTDDAGNFVEYVA